MFSKSSMLNTAVVGGLLAWLFAPVLSGAQSFAFRDASHYYYPLFEWVAGQFAVGQWPWWNPHENLGVPLAADTTASLFYPGKLLFALPCDYTLLFNLYVVGHVALAAWGSYALARRWGVSQTGSLIASLSYAFGASVLFQTCNVIFLVGAAWLPWAMRAARQMMHEHSCSAASAFGVVLALMVTGGDPQMAYNAALLAGLYGVILWRTERCAPRNEETARRGFRPPGRLTLVVFGAAIGLLLAAVQVLPSMEAAALSGRGAYDSPRSLYELGSWWGHSDETPSRPWHEGLTGRAATGHQRQIYQFELAPWRLLELLWPNVGGQPFPAHRRWAGTLGWEGSLWTPSLYLGLLPLALAAVTWNVRRASSPETRWASWMVLLGTLASFGSYGLAWLVALPLGGSEAVGWGAEVGGIYWWMTVLLPGYVYFRYPAKMFVVATLGISLLAARGWDQGWQSGSRGLGRWWLVVLGLSLVALGALPWAWPPLAAAALRAPADPLLGPFDAVGARHDVGAALMHTAVLGGVLAALLAWSKRHPRHAAVVGRMAVLLTALDLGIAQRALLVYAPAEDWLYRPPLVDKLPRDLENYRVIRQLRVLPPPWQRASSPTRFGEVLRWNRATLSPKFGLRYGISMAEAAGTVVPYEYSSLLDWARQTAHFDSPGILPSGAMLNVIAARVAIVEPGALRDGIEPIDQPAADMVAGLRSAAQRRAWVVHEVTTLPALNDRRPSQLEARGREVLLPAEPRDWRTRAVVETDVPLDPAPISSLDPAHEHCEITANTPTKVELMVRLDSPGLLVLADQFYPGWEATVETGGQVHDAPIVRTNRVLRGLALPAGGHRVTFRYRPRSLAQGGAISLAALVALAAWGAAARWSRRGSKSGS